MYDQGAMTGDRANGVKAFQMSYGAGNTKTYHYVYGNGKIGNLKKVIQITILDGFVFLIKILQL